MRVISACVSPSAVRPARMWSSRNTGSPGFGLDFESPSGSITMSCISAAACSCRLNFGGPRKTTSLSRDLLPRKDAAAGDQQVPLSGRQQPAEQERRAGLARAGEVVGRQNLLVAQRLTSRGDALGLLDFLPLVRLGVAEEAEAREADEQRRPQAHHQRPACFAGTAATAFPVQATRSPQPAPPGGARELKKTVATAAHSVTNASLRRAAGFAAADSPQVYAAELTVAGSKLSLKAPFGTLTSTGRRRLPTGSRPPVSAAAVPSAGGRSSPASGRRFRLAESLDPDRVFLEAVGLSGERFLCQVLEQSAMDVGGFECFAGD